MEPPNTSSLSQEDMHTLPEYTRNILPELNNEDLPSLILASHAHSPSLDPAPDLKIDVRNLSNPPKQTRDAYNGTSKRLQEWMKKDPVLIARRDAIRTQIEAAMTKKMDERQRKDVLKLEPADTEKGRENHWDENGDEEDEEDVDWSSGDDDRTTKNDGLILRVGIFCDMGRHRSVAMIEELAKMSWPGWQAEVEHRDVSKKRGGRKKADFRDRKSRGMRGEPSSYDSEDY